MATESSRRYCAAVSHAIYCVTRSAVLFVLVSRAGETEHECIRLNRFAQSNFIFLEFTRVWAQTLGRFRVWENLGFRNILLRRFIIRVGKIVFLIGKLPERLSPIFFQFTNRKCD